jgi:hypothetical protein
MTIDVLVPIFGAVIVVAAGAVGAALKQLHTIVLRQGQEAAVQRAEIRGYAERSANNAKDEAMSLARSIREEAVTTAQSVRAETMKQEDRLINALSELKESFDASAERQDRQWELHHQEHVTFRDLMLQHEGRISNIEGALPDKIRVRPRQKKDVL